MPATVGFRESWLRASTAPERRVFHDSAVRVSDSRIRGRTSVSARSTFLARSRSGMYVAGAELEERVEGEARWVTAVARKRRSTRSAFRASDFSIRGCDVIFSSRESKTPTNSSIPADAVFFFAEEALYYEYGERYNVIVMRGNGTSYYAFIARTLQRALHRRHICA